jgi:hypothetical protein
VTTMDTTAKPAVIEPGQSLAGGQKPESANPAAKPAQVNAKPSKKVGTQLAAQDNPTQFELNETTRSKSWPTSNQDMDGYLARHNEMIGSNANNGLISYAQILTEPTEIPAEQFEQGSKQENK